VRRKLFASLVAPFGFYLIGALIMTISVEPIRGGDGRRIGIEIWLLFHAAVAAGGSARLVAG